MKDHCPDAARPVKIGATYYFVAKNIFSKENGVLYGNVDEGLFPATIEMRKKIEAILKNDTRY